MARTRKGLKLDQIYHGDCLELMNDIPDNSIDMVLCDLPYGMTQNKWDCEIDLDDLWNQYLAIGTSSCIFALHSAQPFTSKLVCSQLKLWRHEWVWIKNRGSNFANTVREPMKEHETIQVFSRGKWTYNKQMQERTGSGADRVKYNVAFRTASKNYREFDEREKNQLPEQRVPSSWQKFNTDTSRLHPTIKPIDLAEYLIKTYTNKGDVVLDNCCGSGTTCLAAKRLGRRFIGIEQDQKYFKIAQERVNNG